MIGPCHWKTNALETSLYENMVLVRMCWVEKFLLARISMHLLNVVESGRDDRRIVPAPFCLNSIERVTNIPPRIDSIEEFAGRDWGKFRGRGTCHPCAIRC